jgi:hypothetical protein
MHAAMQCFKNGLTSIQILDMIQKLNRGKKYHSLFCHTTSDEGKKFLTLASGVNVIQLFCLVTGEEAK